MGTQRTGVLEAIELAGGQSSLARKIGVSPQAIHQWIRAGAVPPRRVIEVSNLTGIPPHKLNAESHPKRA